MAAEDRHDCSVFSRTLRDEGDLIWLGGVGGQEKLRRRYTANDG
jgi:hypothetical protein